MAKGQVKRRKKAGRPVREFSPGVVDLLEVYQGSGTVTSITQYLGISVDKFYQWLKDEPDFSEAVKNIRRIVDDDVEEAFLKRAKGFEHTEYHETIEDGGPSGHKTISKTVTKYVAPDPGAAFNWLKNRRPEWRDKREVELTGSHVVLLRRLIEAEKQADE